MGIGSLSGIEAPIAILPTHVTAILDCGETSLNEWLKKRALGNEKNGASRCYVITADNRVIGYYCISAGIIAIEKAPKTLTRNMPDPIPVLVMGRLAIDKSVQGAGLGKALLKDAILRSLHVSHNIGVKALLVHALSDTAKAFYLSHGFLPSPIQPMTLCLPLETARKILAE